MRGTIFALATLLLACNGPGNNSDAALPGPDAALDAGAEAAVSPDGGAEAGLAVTRVMVGTPQWELASVQQFAAPLGTRSTNFSQAIDTLSALLAPGHVWYRTAMLFGPGAAHAGPYADELGQDLARAGYQNTAQIAGADFTEPRGLFLLAMVTPREGAPVGSSADSPSGPLVPNSIFGLSLHMEMFREGVHWDSFSDSTLPATTALSPPRADDGWSHLVLLFGESVQAAGRTTLEPGRYEWRLTVLDNTRSGWQLTVPFTLTP